MIKIRNPDELSSIVNQEAPNYTTKQYSLESPSKAPLKVPLGTRLYKYFRASLAILQFAGCFLGINIQQNNIERITDPVPIKHYKKDGLEKRLRISLGPPEVVAADNNYYLGGGELPEGIGKTLREGEGNKQIIPVKSAETSIHGKVYPSYTYLGEEYTIVGYGNIFHLIYNNINREALYMNDSNDRVLVELTTKGLFGKEKVHWAIFLNPRSRSPNNFLLEDRGGVWYRYSISFWFK